MSDYVEDVVDLGGIFHACPAPYGKVFAVVEREIVAALTELASCAFNSLVAGIEVIIHEFYDSCEL